MNKLLAALVIMLVLIVAWAVMSIKTANSGTEKVQGWIVSARYSNEEPRVFVAEGAMIYVDGKIVTLKPDGSVSE